MRIAISEYLQGGVDWSDDWSTIAEAYESEGLEWADVSPEHRGKLQYAFAEVDVDGYIDTETAEVFITAVNGMRLAEPVQA
jgi:hypothetical protein